MVPIFVLLAEWNRHLHVYQCVNVDTSVELDEKAMVFEQNCT
jgi:hypothetical protein